MDIIARFPRLPPLAGEEVVTPSTPAHRSTPRRGPTFPTGSVAALAAVAAVAWSLAAWHESTRLAGQQRPERLALQPPSGAQQTPATPTP